MGSPMILLVKRVCLVVSRKIASRNGSVTSSTVEVLEKTRTFNGIS